MPWVNCVCQAKVGDAEAVDGDLRKSLGVGKVVRADEDVLRLEVAVDEARDRVRCVFHPAGDLEGEEEGLFDR
jgi:hypothetical protein